ncbi:MAG: Glu/Leu/Phe/Val dehydrogenase [Deltaproteobacteria bacterium]|nr:MAG: Glu/Leu/Phe/Val dehydrogenase [Deltaproteobacteria bacterium]
MPLEEIRELGHEQVVFVNEREAGLKAIIAIHNTTLGPGLGGLRMWPYESEAEALTDVLRLSRGMTYKAAAAGLNLGGGKAVIIGDPKKDKSETLFRAFGRAVNALGGRYITAEDVGTDVYDMEYIYMETGSVTGLDTAHGGSGDPSPFTALGVLQGMRAAAEFVWGDQRLRGKKVAIQGLGHVGLNLAKLVVEDGASVVACDIDADRVETAKKEVPGIEIVPADDDSIFGTGAEILAPCALGGAINERTIDKITAKIIAGAANNQLADDAMGAEVHRRGILYCPDYVINAGGLINVSVELEGYSRERALRLTQGIFHNTLRILKIAQDEEIPTSVAADRLAEARIASIGKVRGAFGSFHRGRGTSTTAQGRPFSR